MNIHSVQSSKPIDRIREARQAGHILRAATDVFAARLLQCSGGRRRARGRGRRRHRLPLLPQQGRPAGLDFRADHARGDRGRPCVQRRVADPVERLRAIARAASRAAGPRPQPGVVFQVELRQSTKFMERFSTTGLREYLGIIRAGDCRRPGEGAFRADINPTLAAKMFFGALDEMATNWILPSRSPQATQLVDAGRRRGGDRPVRRRARRDDGATNGVARAVAAARCRRSDGRADCRAPRQRRRAGRCCST